MLDDKLKKQLQELTELYELAYKQVKPSVDYIIKNNIRDLKYIEKTFDDIINIPTDRCYQLFLKLYDYVKMFNKELANEYYQIYEELYGDEKIKKRSH